MLFASMAASVVISARCMDMSFLQCSHVYDDIELTGPRLLCTTWIHVHHAIGPCFCVMLLHLMLLLLQVWHITHPLSGHAAPEMPVLMLSAGRP